MEKNAVWIGSSKGMDNPCPIFIKKFHLPTKLSTATICIAANGTYKTTLNGKYIDDRISASGRADITDMLTFNNTLEITLGNNDMQSAPAKLMVSIRIEYINGATETICSGKDWHVKESNHHESKTSEIYNAIELDGNTNDLTDK